MEDILYSYRGRTLKYVLPPPQEEVGEGDELSEVEVAGLVIAGRFFRLGSRSAEADKCRRCGECCLTLGSRIQASPGDVERWIREGREEVLRRLRIEEKDGELITDGTLEIGDGQGRCIFLREAEGAYACAIHETKPEVCREYPLNVGGVCRGGVDFRE
ncbi:MAG: YkgJ family cysteine cluster protein [Euryarchaeota archaeon]|nr:YkgJ family cysteine cluster protein [Euryarchaeota archaeon]